MFIVLILSDKTLIVSLSLALSAITSVVFCGLLFDFELDCETSSFVSTSSFDSSCSLKLENHFLIKNFNNFNNFAYLIRAQFDCKL